LLGCPAQELTNILESLESQRASGGSGALDDDAPDDNPAEDAEEQAKEGEKKAGLLQTFVFSATLTLPQGLRKRLRRGVPCRLNHCTHSMQKLTEAGRDACFHE